MAISNSVNLDLSLAFPRAGVAFAIEARVQNGGGDEASTFRVSVSDASNGRVVPLSVDASPQLADWARGYSRWLARARVRASFDESGIAGTFAADLTPEQVLQGVSEACDMIRQRFEPYEASVLV
jgi:hypothetical protein